MLNHLLNDHGEWQLLMHLWQGVGPFITCKCRQCLNFWNG
jgi:hypothetical protein